jgi:hypothetical protein
VRHSVSLWLRAYIPRLLSTTLNWTLLILNEPDPKEFAPDFSFLFSSSVTTSHLALSHIVVCLK